MSSKPNFRVAFFHHESSYDEKYLDLDRALAARMMESVRNHLGCELVHLTDMTTPALCENVVRASTVGKHRVSWHMDLMATQPGNVLFLDTDTVVQEDVSDIFNLDFDVALTAKSTKFAVFKDREGDPHYMPFNLGVVFSRKPEFWLEIKKRVEAKYTDPSVLHWWGAQMECWKLYNEKHGWNLRLLDAKEFNYTPESPEEDLKGKAIVHYKGAHRKHWNLPGFKFQGRVRTFWFGRETASA